MAKKTERHSLCGQVFSSGIYQMKHEAGCGQCQALRTLLRQGKLGTLLEKAKAEGLVAEAPQRTEEPKRSRQRWGTIRAAGTLLLYGVGILIAASFFVLVVAALLKYVFWLRSS